jgi:hypothetical protein
MRTRSVEIFRVERNVNFHQVMFPAGLLQSPVFDPHQPKYINYGLSGSIIASELSVSVAFIILRKLSMLYHLQRSFVQVGRYFSATGELRSWWDNGTTRNFEEIQRCFQNQQSGVLWFLSILCRIVTRPIAASRNRIGKAFQTVSLPIFRWRS